MNSFPIEPIPRVFGELADEHSWIVICRKVEQLDSVEIISLVADGEGTQVQFKYEGYVFSVSQRSEARVLLEVEDGDCPQELLATLVQHFLAVSSGNQFRR